jgi:hypothetical protein
MSMMLDSLKKLYVHELKDLQLADQTLSRLAERKINFEAMMTG